MKPIKLMAMAFTALALTPLSASADNECDRYQTSYDRTYCMSKISAEADNELNIVYKQLRSVINAATKKQLVYVQRDWLKYRNATCENSGTIDVNCNYRLNKERTEFLRDRLRECRAGTCRASAILNTYWR